MWSNFVQKDPSKTMVSTVIWSIFNHFDYSLKIDNAEKN